MADFGTFAGWNPRFGRKIKAKMKTGAPLCGAPGGDKEALGVRLSALGKKHSTASPVKSEAEDRVGGIL